MNIKPTPEQVREWHDQAYNEPNIFGNSVMQRIAELAAQWGAEQAQQATVEEPELPEPAYLYDESDEVFYRPLKAPADIPLLSLYTAAHLHAFADAKVRAAMAQQSQDAGKEVVTMTIPLSHINTLQVESIKRLVSRTKHAHMTDVRIRINGSYEYFEADWIKHIAVRGNT